MMRPTFQNIDCQSVATLTGAHSGWLKIRDKSSKWLKKFLVLYRGHAYIFKNNASNHEENDFSLYGYLSCSAERSTEIEQREGLWIIKIIPAENIKKQSRYFALSSEGDFDLWTDHFSKELQMAGVQKNTKLIKGLNYNSKMAYSSVNKTIGKLSMKYGVRPNNEKVITVSAIIPYLTVEISSSVNNRVLVLNVGSSTTTKYGLECFVNALTGKDVQGIFLNQIGKPFLEFGDFIAQDVTAVEQVYKKETWDSNCLQIKPFISFRNIFVKRYKTKLMDYVCFYFYNAIQSSGEDVEEQPCIGWMPLHNGGINEECKRRHSLKLKTQMYHEFIDRSNETDFLTTRKANTKLLNGQRHYNYDFGRSTAVIKNSKRRISDVSNSPTCHIRNKSGIYTSFVGNTEFKRRKIEEVLPEAINRLPERYRIRYHDLMQSSKTEKRHLVRVMIDGKKSAGKTCLFIRLLKEIHDVTSTDGVDIVDRRCKISIDDGKWTIGKDINKNKNYPIRENLASFNAEGNTTFLHTSKAASVGNVNHVQDANVPPFNRGRKKREKSGLVKSLSKAEENFLDVYNLCVLKGGLSVQLYFSRKVPESTLAAHLENYANDLKFSHWKCPKEQLDLLFPAASGTVCSKNFDFSLLYKLIRNTLPLMSPPTRGWGSKPLPGDITELDDIERIRYYRTLLANNTEFKLKNAEFKHVMIDLYQAITRLSFGKLSVEIFNPAVHKEMTENIRTDIEKSKDEMNTLHRDMFEDKKDRVFKLQESFQEQTNQLIAFCELETESDSCAPYMPILKEYQTFDISLGAKKREVRDCTITPDGGWIVSDYNNSELIMNGLSMRIKLSKPTFVTCIGGNIAVACASKKTIQVIDISTLKIKKKIQTVETVFGMTNTSAGLFFRAGNAGCRFISSSQIDEIIPISGDNMVYIAVWEDNIFLTNWKSHEINCYNTCGVLQWSFTNENMRSPNGVTTDKEGNVFVVGTYSHNILILSKNYKETNTYLLEDAQMRYPIAIDYDHIRDKLVVCNMKGTVKVFDVAPAVT